MHSPSENILVEAAARGDVAELVRLCADHVDFNDAALYAAIENNHAQCVRALIGSAPVGTQVLGWKPLLKAVVLEHVDCVHELVPFSDPNGCIPEVLCVQNMDCLRAVLPSYSPQCLNEMFEWLLVQPNIVHHVDKIEILLPFADPRVFQGHALKRVVESENIHLIDVLYDRCNPLRALAHLKREYPTNPQMWAVLESTIQAQKIASEIDRKGVSVVRKM